MTRLLSLYSKSLIFIAAYNLFEDPTTSVHECENFKLSIIPQYFGKLDVELPCHREFTLLTDAYGICSLITFKFSDVCVINQVMFDARPFVWDDCSDDPVDVAYDKDIRKPYLYVLEVSKDGVSWTTVIDHSVCKCYCTQELYFPRHAARYVKVIIVTFLL